MSQMLLKILHMVHASQYPWCILLIPEISAISDSASIEFSNEVQNIWLLKFRQKVETELTMNLDLIPCSILSGDE